MFVHLWKIFCEECVFSILREKKWEVLSLLSSLFLFCVFKPDCWKAERTSQETSGKIHCHQGSLCSSATSGLNHLTIRAQCVSLTSRTHKTYMWDTKGRKWFGSYWSLLPNWRRKGRFEWNPKTEKRKKKTGEIFFSTPLDNKDKWMDCISDTNGQIWERKRPCVVTVGPIMWRPLGRPVGYGRAGWLVVIAGSRLIGQWSTTWPHPSVGKLISR